MPEDRIVRINPLTDSMPGIQNWREKRSASVLDQAYAYMAHAIALLKQVSDQPETVVRAALARHRIGPLEQPGDVFTQADRLQQVLQTLRDKVEAPD